MRIACPHCGTRGVDEFVYLGDASLTRPDPNGPDALAAFVDYVYTRDNPFGRHRELWQHALGCQSWVVVTRDVRSHAIEQVEPARDVALARTIPPRAKLGEGGPAQGAGTGGASGVELGSEPRPARPGFAGPPSPVPGEG